MSSARSASDGSQIGSKDEDGETFSSNDFPVLQTTQCATDMTKNTSRTYSLLPEDSPSPDRIGDSSNPIEAELYMTLIDGKKTDIPSNTKLWEMKYEEDKNSVLHIAACAGNTHLLRDIIPECKDVIKDQNLKGDLAFHCAAKAAQLDALKALIEWRNYDAEVNASSELLMKINNKGDTALQKNQKEMAKLLFKECPGACYKLNKEKVIPLYLAIKLGYRCLVKDMIEDAKKHQTDSENALKTSKSVIHAVIDAQKEDILEELLNNHETLVKLLDDNNQTPLSHAAFIGFQNGVQYLLQKFPNSEFICDKNGSFPIHNAVRGGHVKVVKHFQRTRKLLNKKGQNILHVAAANGKAEVLSDLLSLEEFSGLINSKDDDGNTPLHLATKRFHPRVVYILTRQKGVNLHMRNNDGLTAQDVADIYAEPSPPFEERMTWLALRYVDAPRSSLSTLKRFLQDQANGENPTSLSNKNDKSDHLKRYQARVDTLILVATLVATVTFAAGFTAPGGYLQDEPGRGMAVLEAKPEFQAFVIFNTAALYSSILSVVILIWAQLADLKLILVSLKFALPLLGFSLSMMIWAFTMGIFDVLKNLPWLSYVVLGIGCLSMLAALVIFIPLYSPSSIRNRVVRWFFSGTFLLLLYVGEKFTNSYA